MNSLQIYADCNTGYPICLSVANIENPSEYLNPGNDLVKLSLENTRTRIGIEKIDRFSKPFFVTKQIMLELHEAAESDRCLSNSTEWLHFLTCNETVNEKTAELRERLHYCWQKAWELEGDEESSEKIRKEESRLLARREVLLELLLSATSSENTLLVTDKHLQTIGLDREDFEPPSPKVQQIVTAYLNLTTPIFALNTREANELLNLARKLKLTDLAEAVEEILPSQSSTQWQNLEVFPSFRRVDSMNGWIVDQISSQFLNLPRELPKELARIPAELLECVLETYWDCTEYEILSVVLHWCRKAPEAERKKLNLLKVIRWELLSNDERDSLINDLELNNLDQSIERIVRNGLLKACATTPFRPFPGSRNLKNKIPYEANPVREIENQFLVLLDDYDNRISELLDVIEQLGTYLSSCTQLGEDHYRALADLRARLTWKRDITSSEYSLMTGARTLIKDALVEKRVSTLKKEWEEGVALHLIDNVRSLEKRWKTLQESDEGCYQFKVPDLKPYLFQGRHQGDEEILEGYRFHSCLLPLEFNKETFFVELRNKITSVQDAVDFQALLYGKFVTWPSISLITFLVEQGLLEPFASLLGKKRSISADLIYINLNQPTVKNIDWKILRSLKKGELFFEREDLWPLIPHEWALVFIRLSNKPWYSLHKWKPGLAYANQVLCNQPEVRKHFTTEMFSMLFSSKPETFQLIMDDSDQLRFVDGQILAQIALECKKYHLKSHPLIGRLRQAITVKDLSKYLRTPICLEPITGITLKARRADETLILHANTKKTFIGTVGLVYDQKEQFISFPNGYNTPFRIPINSLTQPSPVQVRIYNKEVNHATL